MSTGLEKRIGELLLVNRLITPNQLEQAIALQKVKRKRLGKVMIELGFVTDQQVAKVLSDQLKLPVVKLEQLQIDRQLFDVINQSDAEKYMVLPLKLKGNTLFLAMADPLDYQSIDEIRFKTGFHISPVIATERDLISGIERSYEVAEKVKDIIKSVDGYDGVEFVKEEVRADKSVNEASLFKLSEAPPIIRLVTMVMVEAVRMRASDVHIEPREESVIIRYRVDGDLREVLKLPKKVQDSVVCRIKIVSDLDIANRRLPQDGSTKLRVGDRIIDLRVSTLPSLFGEKIVIRLLDKSKGLVRIDKLGFPPDVKGQLLASLSQPQGFVLVTGPTGSGKSTTLYSLLLETNSSKDNVVTVEDPVEYKIEGITQVGVNPPIGLTFASVLRSVLRQDPDIIMVGEIRDLETADIAIKSALTGHLVLSTLHTNDTIASVTRLIDLGIPPFLVSSSLTCVLAQRLVKRICDHCREPDPALPERLGARAESVGRAFKGRGCERCQKSGYRGQVGVFEFLPVTTRLRRLIASAAGEDKLKEAAREAGVRTLFENALQKVSSGETSLDEVLAKVPDTGAEN